MMKIKSLVPLGALREDIQRNIKLFYEMEFWPFLYSCVLTELCLQQMDAQTLVELRTHRWCREEEGVFKLFFTVLELSEAAAIETRIRMKSHTLRNATNLYSPNV